MKRVGMLIFLAVLLCPAGLYAAVQPDEILSNPALEARARSLSQQLRCMVCQNESIDDSDAPLAHERLVAGDSDAQIFDFLVARYGEFVLLKPRLSWGTAALWGLPPALLLTGIALLIFAAKRRRRDVSQIPVDKLTAAEEAKLQRILAEGGGS
jgi:cytochrome c-type biogenesis protein CcmH